MTFGEKNIIMRKAEEKAVSEEITLDGKRAAVLWGKDDRAYVAQYRHPETCPNPLTVEFTWPAVKMAVEGTGRFMSC